MEPQESQVKIPEPTGKKESSQLPILIAVVAAIVAIASLGAGMAGVYSSDNESGDAVAELQSEVQSLSEKLDDVEQQEGFSVNEGVNKDGFQAVFLVDGQIYFGKLSDGLPGQVKLENIYYLQTGTDSEIDSTAKLEELGPQISLAKLGNEIHGPEDVMHISRDQVRFWENLKEDSQVVTAIRAFEGS